MDSTAECTKLGQAGTRAGFKIKRRIQLLICKSSAKEPTSSLGGVEASTASPTTSKTLKARFALSLVQRNPTKSKSDQKEFKLPDKYALLGEIFDRMEVSIRLLKLRKQICTFTNICPRVEQMTRRKFTYSHLAQIKYLLNEAMEVEKILIQDTDSVCMKRELLVTLRPNALESHKDGDSRVNTTAILRKTFHVRLLEFAKSHPEEDVPEALLPEPFNRKGLSESVIVALKYPEISITASKSLDSFSPAVKPNKILKQISSQGNTEPPITSSHLPQTFKRHFSQRPYLSQQGVKSSSFASVTEPAYSTGVKVLPSYVLDHVVNSNQREVFEQENELEEKNSEVSRCNNSLRVSDDSKHHLSPKTRSPNTKPFENHSSDHEDENGSCYGTPCSTLYTSTANSSFASAMFHSCSEETLGEDGSSFSSSIPVSSMFRTPNSGVPSADDLPTVKSLQKLWPREQINSKPLEYESSLTPLSTLENNEYFASPSISTPNTPSGVTSPVQNLENSYAMTSLDIECPSKQCEQLNLVGKGPSTSSKTKEMQFDFDDLSSVEFQSAHSSRPSTPETLYQSVHASSPSSHSTIIIPNKDKKDQKVADSLTFNSPAQNFGSEITQEECKWVKKVSDYTQRGHVEEGSTKAVIGGISEHDEETVSCLPLNQVWRSLSCCFNALCSWFKKRRDKSSEKSKAGARAMKRHLT